MKKLLVLAAALCVSAASFAQEAASGPASRPGGAAGRGAGRMAMPGMGVVKGLDAAAKSFSVTGMSGDTMVKFTDKLIVLAPQAAETPGSAPASAPASIELADGQMALAIGNVADDQSSITAFSLNLVKPKEGAEPMTGMIAKNAVLGTVKKEGEKISLVVKSAAGEEKTVAVQTMGNRAPHVNTLEVKDVTALKDGDRVMAVGQTEATTINADAVIIMPARMGAGAPGAGRRGGRGAGAPGAGAPGAAGGAAEGGAAE